jgi:hypothetical protein
MYAEEPEDIKGLEACSGKLTIVRCEGNFTIGIPVPIGPKPDSVLRNNAGKWGMQCLAIHLKHLNVRAGATVHTHAIEPDKFIIEPIPPQDLVKYLNHLTDAGVEYLKELKV